MAHEMADLAPNYHYIGWDLAHTDKGWIMVEGNPRGMLVMMQMFYRLGFKEEVENYLSNM